MKALKFTIRDITFEYPVEDDEAAINIVKSILTKIGEHQVQNLETLSSFIDTPTKSKRKRLTPNESMVNLPLKSDGEVMSYILKQPKFAHDLFSVQKNVYGDIFKSRGSGKKMYYKTFRQLRQVRDKIEAAYTGKFRFTEDQNTRIKEYFFEPMASVTITSQ
ncbi:MAG TPA: hypothetical protein VK487_01635 [Candidatus Bathyarchaeia archaeon]|nr:hypothetical protein [Candidatus Bathyarchaeia archaeon]